MPQKELQKSRDRFCGTGEGSRAYLDRDVVEADLLADMIFFFSEQRKKEWTTEPQRETNTCDHTLYLIPSTPALAFDDDVYTTIGFLFYRMDKFSRKNIFCGTGRNRSRVDNHQLLRKFRPPSGISQWRPRYRTKHSSSTRNFVKYRILL